jgi:hypothetical protein
LRGITVFDYVLYSRETALTDINSTWQGIWLEADMIYALVARDEE